MKHNKIILLLALMIILILPLVACSNDNNKSKDNSQIESNQSQEKEENKQTVSGIINRLDGNLVLLAEDNYYVFTLDTGVTLDGLEEADEVTVTYTGTLVEQSDDLVATSIVKK